jgi:hypothetical protein
VQPTEANKARTVVGLTHPLVTVASQDSADFREASGAAVGAVSLAEAAAAESLAAALGAAPAGVSSGEVPVETHVAADFLVAHSRVSRAASAAAVVAASSAEPAADSPAVDFRVAGFPVARVAAEVNDLFVMVPKDDDIRGRSLSSIMLVSSHGAEGPSRGIPESYDGKNGGSSL